MTSVELVLAFAAENRRVCPKPQKWQQLYELLPHSRRKGAGWEPALPLILAAWHETPDLAKIMRLREHIEWAGDHGAIDAVYAFLQSLKEDDWHHVGE